MVGIPFSMWRDFLLKNYNAYLKAIFSIYNINTMNYLDKNLNIAYLKEVRTTDVQVISNL